MEHGLSLSTETHLFGIVTTLSLCEVGCFAGLVLCDLVVLMLTAFLTGAESFAFLGYVHHGCVRQLILYLITSVNILRERESIDTTFEGKRKDMQKKI